MMKSVLV